MKNIISILFIIIITSFDLKSQNIEIKIDSMRFEMSRHTENNSLDSLKLVVNSFRQIINNLDDQIFVNYINKHSISDNQNIRLNNKLELSISKSKIQSLILLLICLLSFIYLIRFTDKKSREKQTKKLDAAKTISVYELELRRKISERLHDDIGGSIAALKMQLSKNKNLKKETKALNSIYNDIRILSQDLDMQNKLHPSIKTSAEDLIQEMCSNFKTTTLNIFPEKEIEKITNQRLNNDIILTLKELITNIINHANATNISIDISKQENNLVILVQDDGLGFDFNRKEGQGLKSIRNRCILNEGELFIDSNQKNGTTITVTYKI
tara:strand:+ start:245 stop:1219 length:975 start_codon:yes stop_codon:yes gene_type:complete